MLRVLLACLTVLPLLSAAAAPTAADMARQIQQAGLDAGECYRVIDLNFSKQDIRVFFTSGYLIFAKPVNGLRTGALFTAEVEGGDGELLLLPPTRGERLSLASFTDTPNLDEHFRSAVLIFTDDTAAELLAALREKQSKKVSEMGALLADKYSSLLENLSGSFQERVVQDLLGTDRKRGLLYMGVSGARSGTFDLIYDPRIHDDILVGQVSARDNRNYFDVWTAFPDRSRRAGNPAVPLPDVKLGNYRIDATVAPNLLLKAVTRVTVTAKENLSRAVEFSISNQMRVTEASVDGQPAEVFQRDSLRSNLIRSNDNEQFLVVAATDLESGKPHEFEFHHEGAVISTAGDQVYYVGARGGWYPRRDLDFSRYDLTFRYPKSLNLVATGDVVEDKTAGDQRITRRTTSSPIRFAGFNLGDYKSVMVVDGPYRIEVYANKRVETALKPKAPPPPQPGAAWSRRHAGEALDGSGSSMTVPPDPAARLHLLADDVASAFDFMAEEFGPPPIRTLTVSPIPGRFGQGFPGLLYLSTLAYLEPEQRPESARSRFQQTFYSEMLDAHEVAHQWWGNLVTTASYQDSWLMEALANYSALLFLERKKGPHALEAVLDDFRIHLTGKMANGKTLESAGPLTWGYRLVSSQAPEAWHFITYEKGAWVMHMLRRTMGDDRFMAFLRAVCTRYRFQPLTTDEFRQMAVEFLPPHSADGDLRGFFDNWVYGTGIPAVKLTYSVHGLKVTGTVVQSGVSDDFTALIPVEVVTGKQRALRWVATGSEAVPFSISLKAPATRVALDTRDALIVGKR